MPPPLVAEMPPPDDGKNDASAEGEESKPSWPSMSDTSAEVTVPVLLRSSTAKDSRIVCSCCGGMWESGSLIFDAR